MGPKFGLAMWTKLCSDYSKGYCNMHLKDSPIKLRGFNLVWSEDLPWPKCQYLGWLLQLQWMESSKTSCWIQENHLNYQFSRPHFPSFVGCRIEFMDRQHWQKWAADCDCWGWHFGSGFCDKKMTILESIPVGGLNSPPPPEFPFPTWKRLWLKSKRKNIWETLKGSTLAVSGWFFSNQLGGLRWG